MGFIDPLIAIVVSMCFLVVLLYKRINLGIVLNATALLLALLSLDWPEIPTVIFNTTDPRTLEGRLSLSIVFATFVIMLLSQLYKETGMINRLSESVGKTINNPKIVLGVLPAIIGFLPVSGGALMSAPLVDVEAEKLEMKPDRKAYVNLWFRHTIFPVYPISQPLVVTAGLTGIAIPLIILRQIPVVVVMVVAGYVIGFWKISSSKSKEKAQKADRSSHSKDFLIAFSPIFTSLIVAIILELIGVGFAQQGFDVLIATLGGLAVLMAISKSSFNTFAKPFKNWGVYGVTLAAYGAFFLRNVMVAAGISRIFSPLVTNGNIDVILLLAVAPAVLGLLTGSPQGGVAISVSILSGILAPFTPKVAAMIYISAYLGYTIAPTHLCFAFTADYFKCPMSKIYRYVIPSFIASFLTALLVYFLF